jgi:hypothetical protein
MSRIFICYRRNDSAGHAGWLQKELESRFGRSRVYMDIDSIPAGALWEEELQKALSGAAAVLIVIGQHWLNPVHRERLHARDDHVRQEISRALRTKGLRVVPVRVHGAEMPKTSDLPQDIRGLLKRQAFVLHDGSFLSDVQKLIRQLEKLPGLKDGGAAKSRKPAKNKARSTAGTPDRNGSVPGTRRKPGPRAAASREEAERSGGTPKPRRRQPAKQPASVAPSKEPAAKRPGNPPAEPKKPDGQSPARPSQPRRRKPAAKQPATPAPNGGKPGGRKTSGPAKNPGNSADGGKARTPKQGGGTPKTKPPAQKAPKAGSSGAGARRS